MELTWYGRTCIRLRGKDAVVLADPFTGIVGPTGRGVTAEIVTFSADRFPSLGVPQRLPADGTEQPGPARVDGGTA